MNNAAEVSVTFSDLGMSEQQCDTVAKLGYETPTPIQQRCIPALLSGKNVLGQAQTGTGKTAAFALPLLSKIDVKTNKTQILVLAPTRELAIQVSEAFEGYASRMRGVQVLPIFGGQPIGRQLSELRRGPQVVVGTPGRVMDHLRRGTLRLDALQAIVLDEADEMLKMGFIDDVEWILEQCPEEKQVALFSATMPPRIRNVAKKHLKDAEEIHVRVSQKTLELVEQFYWQITGTHRLDALARILEVENYQGVLIFVRTKSATLELSEKLRSRGYSSAALNGDMNQRDRERTIQRLKDSKVDIVIATDVAARGLDVDRITHVVNYDIPYDAETYVHRIGRTGRAGRSGKAILFVAPREKRLLRTIERATKGTISPLTLPTRDELIEIRQNILKKKIIKIAEKRDLVPQSKMIEELMAENEISAVQVAAALTHLIQRDQEPIPQDISSSDRPPRNRPHARFSKNKGNRRSDSGERGGRKFQRRDKRHGGGGSPKRRSPGSGRPNNRNASR